MTSITRLNDENVRQFICNGVLLVDSDVDSEIHQGILHKLKHLNGSSAQTASNILPQVPALQNILDAPNITGALSSLLGDGFMLHPMRIIVPSEPLAPEDRALAIKGDENGPPLGEGSRSYTYWHKDTYAPLGRARYHTPRFLFLFYFPQDTPVEMGPTRVIPGSQYQDHTTEVDHPYAYVPTNVRAGTCILTSYDIDHAGMSNRTEQTRHMVKFVFFRTQTPDAPSWAGGHNTWQPPTQLLGQHKLPHTWSYIWDWMRGETQRPLLPADNMSLQLAHLNSEDQQARIEAIYTLGSMGPLAVQPLIEKLLAFKGRNLIDPPYIQNPDGSFETIGDPLERRWTEGGYQFQDEALALGCLGEHAVEPLTELLTNPDPWIVINAAYALGQIGSTAAGAVPYLADLLDDADHRVVRAVLEAIACIGSNTKAALPAIENLLRTPREQWRQTHQLEHLVGDQIHYNAVYALLLSDLHIEQMEDLLIELLERPAPNICVPATALELLLRRGTSVGQQCAIRYLQTRRWDETDWPGVALPGRPD
ncbi:MAG: HEAT repeat domain-containing protein [bacterium]